MGQVHEPHVSSSLRAPASAASAGRVSAEAYPVDRDPDEAIAEFITRRFDQSVQPSPWVLGDKFLRLEGTYARPSTRFWSAIRQRAAELLGPEADPHVDYAMTEVVRCKSKARWASTGR